MIRKVQWIKDTIGINILAIPIEQSSMDPFIQDLQEHISVEDFEKYQQMKIKNEGQNYFLLVANDIELKSVGPESVEKLKNVTDFEISDLYFESLGVAQKEENTSYFVICRSKSIDSVRKYLGFSQKPLFINLGFYPRDVESTLKINKLEKIDKFLKLLSQSYYKEENFEFIKNIENYHLDKFDYIYPLKIENTTATFRDDNFNNFTVGLIDNKFRIVAVWSDPKKLPYLSQTLIQKKLKK